MPDPSPPSDDHTSRVRPRRLVLTFGGKRSSLSITSTIKSDADSFWTSPLSGHMPIFNMQAYEEEGEDELESIVHPSPVSLSTPARQDEESPRELKLCVGFESQAGADVDVETPANGTELSKTPDPPSALPGPVPVRTRRSTRPRPQSQATTSTLPMPRVATSGRKSSPSTTRRNSTRGRSSTLSNNNRLPTSADSIMPAAAERNDAGALNDQLNGTKTTRPGPRQAEMALIHQGMDDVDDCKRLSSAQYASREWRDTEASGIKALDMDGYDAEGKPRKPNLSYDQMIRLCIAGSPQQRMTLREILSAIELRWPWFRVNHRGAQGWQNTVRHTLTLHHHFVNTVRVPGENGEGRGGWWSINNENRKHHRSRSKQTSSTSVSPGGTQLSSASTPIDHPKSTSQPRTAEKDSRHEDIVSEGTRQSAMQQQAIVHQVDGGSYTPPVSQPRPPLPRTNTAANTPAVTVPPPQSWTGEEFRHGTRRWLQQHPPSHSSAYSPGPSLLRRPSDSTAGPSRAEDASGPSKRRKTSAGSLGANECPRPRFEHGRPAYPSPPVIAAQNSRTVPVSTSATSDHRHGHAQADVFRHSQPPPHQSRPTSRPGSASSGSSRLPHPYTSATPWNQHYTHAPSSSGHPHQVRPKILGDAHLHPDIRVPYTSYFPRQTHEPLQLTQLVGHHPNYYPIHAAPHGAHGNGPYLSHRPSPPPPHTSRHSTEAPSAFPTSAPPRHAFPGVEAMMKGERPTSVSPAPPRPVPVRNVSDAGRTASSQQASVPSQRMAFQPSPVSLGSLLNDSNDHRGNGGSQRPARPTTKSRSHSTSLYRWPEGTHIPARLDDIERGVIPQSQTPGSAPALELAHHHPHQMPVHHVQPVQEGQRHTRPHLHVDTTHANRHQEYPPPLITQHSQHGQHTILPPPAPAPQRRVHPPAHPLRYAGPSNTDTPSLESIVAVKQALYGSGTPVREERRAR